MEYMFLEECGLESGNLSRHEFLGVKKRKGLIFPLSPYTLPGARNRVVISRTNLVDTGGNDLCVTLCQIVEINVR